jgi:arylsulfatase A-like enzyme
LIVLAFVSLLGARESKPNILFIAVDDLRPELGCYGNEAVKSPCIDKLAREGVTFTRAYCQQAICMASRASLMSGLRPHVRRLYNCDSLQNLAPDVMTLNRHFENQGYRIWASGKIYHHSEDHLRQFGDRRIEVTTEEVGRGYLDKASVQTVRDYSQTYREMRKQDSGGRGPAYEAPDVPDNAYRDGLMTDLAVAQMARFKGADRPFFMAVGYAKPHLPFNAPRKYWDLYDTETLARAANRYQAKNVSEYFQYNFGELRNYAGIPKGDEPFSEALCRTLKHGYYACVSYVDAQIGRLLDALATNGLDRNTVVILWGDHGWKLGEHDMWCKHTLYEIDNRVPLLIKVPGTGARTGATQALVEFVDIYPSLCELAGLTLPDHLQGTSFVPVLKDPDRAWKRGAVSVYPARYRTDPEKVVMGYSLKTDRYRYTEWVHEKSGDLLARDLFDHRVDPQENQCMARDPQYQSLMNELSSLLDMGRGWRAIAREVTP